MNAVVDVPLFLQTLGATTAGLRQMQTGLTTRWSQPSALDGYSVGALTGHLLMAIRRVEEFLNIDEPDGPVLPPVDYYAKIAAYEPGVNEQPIHVGLRASGHDLSLSGADKTIATIEAIHQRLVDVLPTVSPNRRVPIPIVPGSVALLDGYYLTRTVEMVVHLDDLATSIGVPTPALPDAAVTAVASFLLELAIRRVGGVEVVRALVRPTRARPDALRSI
jgi:uncharacterized protein (TIGR03083 family)